MRFQTKLLLVFLAFALLTSALMLLFTLQSKKLLIEQADLNRRDFSRIIQISAQRLSSIPENQMEKVEQLIQELKKNEAVSEVTIVNKDQKVVASTNPSLVGQSHPLSSMEVVINEKEDPVDTLGRFSPFEITVPIIRDKRITGLVRTTVILRDIRYPLEMLYYKNTIITIIILIIGFGSSLIILKRLNRPLQNLMRAAEKVASGDLSVDIKPVERDEIGQLGAAFSVMTQRLAEQKSLENKLHSFERKAILAELSSFLAHEIRNPLNLIMLTAHYLGTQFVPQQQEQRKKFDELVASLKSEVEHLNQMISNFLSMGKATLKKTRFRVFGLYEQIMVLVRQQITAKSLSFDYQGDQQLELFADNEQLRLVLLNLILNAIAAVSDGGQIALSVSRTSDPRPCAVLVLTDNGPGLNPEIFGQVFEPYFSEKALGVGLGLALVKRIVEEHNGTINADNRPEGGARFTIAIPLEEG
ncbi:MAG: hypothetical protein A2487_00795 [Candidatus Raymondbacteria bacterium RifOxyC12_full_50_8]|uniref:histidine kinase n=1 Tax=Candidatus Raymondbacteria bacterium RIFOXYD12_FULL_49_13 TaxID=1817890 RepID=A0A1F7FA12_UNCRA|nr:MAG: hypothetical protein A2350_03290 [Candidatus Raymondbacteria bacterium RifOxyB12_full_50_8]OGJ93264.1 MAG: hypothetical protein A2248_18015 [Candidatus Raymondbacteria bacterium RIFOXYA2_FULL_49_16]OGJ98169.1 MAG: hypothetical protein A2487_00795 [Candidatus Raymondbacteria bacterium RifOxyC12_full_50_8]OGK03346.1 MAG: hypothetical protein A2519_15360 [Candidatus Raymondbacteria bacterium RIFOXYD12_FULL_49_13]OGP44986.1 MAG: hypothetical protein A2324_19940 [Candidatus Raymondbacteria b